MVLFIYGGLKKPEWMREYHLRFVKNWQTRGEARVRPGTHDPAAKFGRSYARRVRGWIVLCPMDELAHIAEMEAPQYKLQKLSNQANGQDVYSFSSTAGPKEFET